jgi:hypothetical protein
MLGSRYGPRKSRRTTRRRTLQLTERDVDYILTPLVYETLEPSARRQRRPNEQLTNYTPTRRFLNGLLASPTNFTPGRLFGIHTDHCPHGTVAFVIYRLFGFSWNENRPDEIETPITVISVTKGPTEAPLVDIGDVGVSVVPEEGAPDTMRL